MKNLIPWFIVGLLLFLWWIGGSSPFSLFRKQTQITIEHSTILESIETLGKVELVRYNFKDIVEFEKDDYYWLPVSKVVLIIDGEAVGCIDLKKIKKEDLVIRKDSLFIQLPNPEICYFKINHENSKIYDMKYTYFNNKEMINQAYRIAEKRIKDSALQLKILEQTKQNAETILKPFFQKISEKKVVITYPVVVSKNLFPKFSDIK